MTTSISGPAIDLNADLGESFGQWTTGDDEAMLDVVTSANIACGFHAGDPIGMRRTCRAAVERGVVPGAHVGYRDLAGFGRRFMDIAPDELEADVLYQLGALDGMCRSLGGALRYVKPHGALYHRVSTDPVQAAAVVDAVVAHDPALTMVGLPGSLLLEAARERGLSTVGEAFADRAYNPDGSLVSRREPGAVVHDPDSVAHRVVTLASTGRVRAVDGTEIELDADTVCIHGDSPDAVAMARAVRAALGEAGIAVRPFTSGVPA